MLEIIFEFGRRLFFARLFIFAADQAGGDMRFIKHKLTQAANQFCILTKALHKNKFGTV